MALFSRSKLGFDAISRYLTSSKPPIRNRVPIINQSNQSRTFKSTSKVSSFSSVIVNRSSHSPFFVRNYHVDWRQLRISKPRGSRRWIYNPKNIFIVMLVGSGIGYSIYFGNIETVPYTNRKHLVLVSNKDERIIGENAFKKMKTKSKGKIVPAMDPKSVRVRMILNNIIKALRRGFTEENGGKHKGVKLAAKHLKGLKWEILGVNSKVVNAYCLPGGKIVVFTGLLQKFKTDEEVATIIGHEVAQAVARHSVERITKILWFTIVEVIIQLYLMPDLDSDFASKLSKFLLHLPFSRRMEIEADHIGMLLMAHAGYDPRVAPKVFEKLDHGDSTLKDYISTHPSGKTRSKLLSEAKVMQEAIIIYREAIVGQEVDAS